MDKKLFRSLILLITYAVVLVVVIVKIDAVTGWLGGVLAAFQPLIIGGVIAFILNRPCNFFARLYEKALPGKAQGAARPLAAATAYLIVAAFVTALVALVVPELTHSIEMFIGNLNAYAANFQELFDWLAAKLELEQLANLDLSAGISDSLKNLLTGALDALTNTLPHLIGMTGVLISGVVTGVISFVFSIYMLSGGPRLTAQCRRLRLDVAADLGQSNGYNHHFWKKFRKAVKDANPNALILAEHYGDPSEWLQGDEWDTVMNYDAFMEPVTWFLTGMEKHSDEHREELL